MSTASVRVDRKFAALIPPLSSQELIQLEANILADGCRDPLVVWQGEGILLDGHNRFRICQEHDLPFKTVEIDLEDRDAAKRWIILNQFGRRNLAPYQRAELALVLKPLIEAKAKEKQKRKPQSVPQISAEQNIETRDELATIAGVSHDTIAKADYISTRVDDATKNKLRNSETTINKVYKETRKAEQQEAKAVAKAIIPQDLPAVTERYAVHHGELAAANSPVADASVDWIITDPPYPEEFLPVYSDLSTFAARVLKPGGSLICMIGQSYLPEVIARLGEHLAYHWSLAYLTPGQSATLWERKVNTFWKPLLWYVKGRYEGDWIGDVCKSDANDKEHHHWGQSEGGMADIIERFTYPGQTICDPFCGGGTTGVVAVRMNRLFVGIDIDAKAITTTLERLAEVADA